MAFSKRSKSATSGGTPIDADAPADAVEETTEATDEVSSDLESAKLSDAPIEDSVVVTEDAPIVVEEPPTEVTIVPKVTTTCRIGTTWYSFSQGVRTTVPSEIFDHLKRVDLI